MNEQIAKCDAIQKRENEKRQIEEKKHAEEIEFLRRTSQQLKVLPSNTPKKNIVNRINGSVAHLYISIFLSLFRPNWKGSLHQRRIRDKQELSNHFPA